MFVKQVFHVYNLSDARRIIHSKKIDIIITDIRLKKENGLDFVQEIRKVNVTIPIVIISGHKDENFLLRAIPLGLTSYLLKPILHKDLIQTLTQCAENLQKNNQTLISLKDGWYFNTDLKVLLREDKQYILSKKELLFIELIINNRDRLITKDALIHLLWDKPGTSNAAITNFILRIRKRFGRNFIHTIPDVGYRFKL